MTYGFETEPVNRNVVGSNPAAPTKTRMFSGVSRVQFAVLPHSTWPHLACFLREFVPVKII